MAKKQTRTTLNIAGSSFSVPAHWLALLTQCVVKGETRYALNGVALFASPSEISLVTSDTHRLAAITFARIDSYKPFTQIATPTIIIQAASFKAQVELESDLLATPKTQQVDGQFPRWKDVLPRVSSKPYTLRIGSAPSGVFMRVIGGECGFTLRYVNEFIKGMGAGFGGVDFIGYMYSSTDGKFLPGPCAIEEEFGVADEYTAKMQYLLMPVCDRQ